MVDEKKELSPIDVVGEIRQEQEIAKKIKSSGLKFLGEVAVLPPASEFEESTLVRVGQKVYIKQNDLWEVLIEGNTRTETIKYTTPVGGGCGVDEVKRIVKQEAIPSLSEVPTEKTGEVVNIGGTLYSWDASANGGLGAYVVQGLKYVSGTNIPTSYVGSIILVGASPETAELYTWDATTVKYEKVGGTISYDRTRSIGPRLCGTVTGQNTFPGYTNIQIFQGPLGGFCGAAFVFENHDTTREANIDLASIGVVATKNPNGAPPVSYNLTFNGLRAGVVPAATAGIGVSGNIPGRLISDPVSFDSIARTDGGTYPLVSVRIQTKLGNVAPKYPNGNWGVPLSSLPAWEAEYTELTPEQSNTGSGDWVTDQPSIASFNPTWQHNLVRQFGYPIFFSKEPKQNSFVGFGDSVMIGFGSEQGVTGPLAKFSAISGLPFANFATNGQPFIDTEKIIKAYEPTLPRHSVVCFFVASPNDGAGAQSSYDHSYAISTDVYQYLSDKGHIPVIWTAVPWNGSPSVINKINMRLRSSGLRYFDANLVLRNPANPLAYLPAYTSDNLHPNEAGYTALGAAFNAFRLEHGL